MDFILKAILLIVVIVIIGIVIDWLEKKQNI